MSVRVSAAVASEGLFGAPGAVSLFLSPADLSSMTGLRQYAAIRRWLDRNGIPYTVRRDGFPNVLPADLSRRTADAPRARPRFDAIRRTG